ncbi:MAG: YdeI/OmpD-associated family protein [Planctomycetota bacterium]
MPRAKTVDEYIEAHPDWVAELEKLRRILRSTDLEESIKWGAPSYGFGTKNIVGIGAFKSYVGLWFHQGVFLADPLGVLVNAQDGKTKAMRQWRFDGERVIKVKDVKAYVKEAIENQSEGKEVKVERGKAVDVPPELAAAFRKNRKAKTSFEELTPGKQREFAEHIASAKQDKTKQSRLEKILPMIEAGKGLHDRYRNC